VILVDHLATAVLSKQTNVLIGSVCHCVLLCRYMKKGQVFIHCAVQETDLAMPPILLELGKLLKVGSTDMVMLCDDYDFLLHPARLVSSF